MSEKWAKKYKTTSLSKLDPKITEYLGTLPSHLQQQYLITATSDGKHSKNSLHYTDKAVDMRYNQELWDYISKDPKRHEFGLTLLNPDHGSAKHVHLSNAKGTKNEWHGEIDKEGRRKVYESQGWDLNELGQKEIPKNNANNPNNTVSQYSPIEVSQVSSPIQSVQPYNEQRYILPEQTQPVQIGLDNWNPRGWETGQILLRPFQEQEPKKTKGKKISRQEKEQLNVLLQNVNPTLRGAMEQIIGTVDEDERITSSFGGEEQKRLLYNDLLQGETPNSGWVQNYQQKGSTRQGQYNAGNLRNSDGSFQSFSSPEEGRQALVNQLNRYQTGNTKTKARPDMSLTDAMGVYAPASDNNNPKQYAEFIAKRLNISPNTQIKDIDANAWADAISVMEGNKSYLGSKKENGGTLKQKRNWAERYEQR